VRGGEGKREFKDPGRSFPDWGGTPSKLRVSGGDSESHTSRSGGGSRRVGDEIQTFGRGYRGGGMWLQKITSPREETGKELDPPIGELFPEDGSEERGGGSPQIYREVSGRDWQKDLGGYVVNRPIAQDIPT